MTRSSTKPGEAAGSEAFTTPFVLAAGLHEAASRACSEWQREVARFAGARLEADIEFWRSLGACRSVHDALELQRDWAAQTLEAYTSETGELMQIAARAGQAALPGGRVAGR